MPLEFDSADELAEALDDLPEKLERAAVRSAARQAANVFRDAARRQARAFDDPKTENKLYKHIVTTSGRFGEVKAEGGAVMHVRVKDLQTYFYWYFLEFGTSKMQAQPFMRPAARNNWQEAIERFAEEIGPAIDKQMRKL